MGRLLKATWQLLAVLGLAVVVGGLWFLSQGIGTEPAPGAIETRVARTARHLAIPASERERLSPDAPTSESIRGGMEHWADHCASCHGNDGSGATEMGQRLYPRAPDMRQPDTQELTDGELFYIIEHGVKLTGMPAWGSGTPEGELSSWHLVHFIRRLPSLSAEELATMDDLNPRSEAEWRTRDAERRFLAGEAPLEGELRVGPQDAPHAHPKDPKP